jgi:hypothetical protein
MAYDPARATAELKKVAQEAEELTFGGTPCYQYQIVVPAYPFDFVVLLREHDLLVIKARGSFDRELASNIVSFCEHKNAETTGLTVFEGFSCPGYSFECVTFAPPPISRCFTGESEYLADSATWAFPSYNCEFRSDPNGKDFDFLLGKGGRIEAMDWNREPMPQARIRLLTDWPGGVLAKRKKLGIVQWKSLVHIATNLPPGEEVVVANLDDQEIHISSSARGFNCSGAVSREGLAPADLADFLKTFLFMKARWNSAPSNPIR